MKIGAAGIGSVMRSEGNAPDMDVLITGQIGPPANPNPARYRVMTNIGGPIVVQTPQGKVIDAPKRGYTAFVPTPK